MVCWRFCQLSSKDSIVNQVYLWRIFNSTRITSVLTDYLWHCKILFAGRELIAELAQILLMQVMLEIDCVRLLVPVTFQSTVILKCLLSTLISSIELHLTESVRSSSTFSNQLLKADAFLAKLKNSSSTCVPVRMNITKCKGYLLKLFLGAEKTIFSCLRIF